MTCGSDGDVRIWDGVEDDNALSRSCGEKAYSVAFKVRPNKKIPVFRVTRPYLNLLVKPRIFIGFLGKTYNFMHFERQNAFQNA